MKTIEICKYCGSAHVMRDAFVHVNDEEDVRTYDATYCENCGESCSNEGTVTIEVDPEDADIYEGIFDVSKQR